MISSIYAGQYVSCNVLTHPSVYSTNTRAQPGDIPGDMRYNPQTKVMEYCTGSSWMTISTSSVTMSLDQDVIPVIEWAKTKMVEEAELQSRLDKYPSLKEAYEQFKLLDALTYDETTSNGS